MISRQPTNQLVTVNPDRWLYAFIFVHMVFWTLAPICIRYTLPMDAMEGTTWGHQLEWGYDKNPFMNGWLTALALRLDQQTGWATYLFSQISVGISFWAVWRLGKRLMSPLHALIAVLMLEGCQYYNLHAIDFNDNTLELGLWALTILFFYQALRENQIRHWLLVGLFAGLSVMTKYYTAMLLVSMGLFMLIQPQARARFKSVNLYIGILMFLFVIIPHTLWLFSHGFVTVEYAFKRLSGPPTLLKHLIFPAQFAWYQFVVFLPCILLLIITLFPLRFSDQFKLFRLDFNNLFLIIIGFGPFLLTVLLSATTGIQLRGAWGQPLLALWGIILLVWSMPTITPTKFYRFIAMIFILLVGAVSSYCISLLQAHKPSSANFPGKNISFALTQRWHDLYQTPLIYVTGPRWIAGNIAFYSKDHPNVYIDANKKISPWIDEAQLKRAGAIFVWDPSEIEQVPFAKLKYRFPNLGELQVLHFTWLRNSKLKPVEITVAFLPPESVQSRVQYLRES